MSQRPNILFLLADDLGWGDVGFHDSSIRTPQLDWLAKNGVELTQHYVCPLCTPTRVSFLTGRHPGRFGAQATRPSNPPVLPDGYETLAVVLREAGYDTGLFGKWHMGSEPQFGPNQYGFDHAYGSLAGGVDPYNHCYKRGPHCETWHRNGDRIHERGHVTDLIADEAIRWLHDRPSGGERPWFCYVPFTAVHAPIKAPQSWVGAYNDQVYDGDERRDRTFKMYAAYTSHMDYNIGRIVEVLAEREELENTLIVFSSDNGGVTAMGEKSDVFNYPGHQEAMPRLGTNLPLRGKKGQFYEGGIRTPTIVHWAGRLASGKIGTPMHIADWMPTLLNLAGHAPKGDPQWDGRDIWPVVSGEARGDEGDAGDGSRVFYWNLVNKRFAVRHGQWKLICHELSIQREDCELFDIDNDPYETTDLASDMPAEVDRMLTLLAEQRKYDGSSKRPDVE